MQGLEDVSTYPALTAELLRRGYKDDEIKKILGLNILRVMRGAEKVSAQAAERARGIAVAVCQVESRTFIRHVQIELTRRRIEQSPHRRAR